MAYEIVIHNATTSGNSNKNPVAGSNASGENTSASKQPSESRLAAAKVLGITNSSIKPFVDQMVSQKVTTVTLRTGAQELEERMSVKVQIGQTVWGIASSAATGALVGGLPGAIVGGLLGVATTAIDLSNKQKEIDLQKSVENVGLRYMDVRAGGSVASFSGSRMKSQ